MTAGNGDGQMEMKTDESLIVRVVRLEGSFQLLQQQVNGSLHNLASTNQALQAEVRAMHQKFDALPQLQQKQADLSDAIGRAFEAVDRLANSTSAKLTDMEKEHNATRQRVTWWSGGAAAIACVAAIVVAVSMWYEDKLTEVEVRERAARTQMVIENSQRLREVELAIARSNEEAQQ